MWPRDPGKAAFERILKDLKTRSRAEKKNVKQLDPPIGHWTFAAAEEAFKHHVELDRVCCDGLCSVSGSAAVMR